MLQYYESFPPNFEITLPKRSFFPEREIIVKRIFWQNEANWVYLNHMSIILVSLFLKQTLLVTRKGNALLVKSILLLYLKYLFGLNIFLEFSA